MIVVICPANVVTGGPEALHQLVHTINKEEQGFGAICYVPFESSHLKPSEYEMYDTPTILKQDIPENALVVLPEIYPQMVNDFTQKCAFWWLSVDNYPNTGEEDRNKMHMHLAQSEYAWKHVHNNYSIIPRMLTDYINGVFDTPKTSQRQQRVMVNRVKGAELNEVFAAQNPNLPIFSMHGMPRTEVLKELANSEIYVDFGHHPGRDRMPREAAICGAIVLSIRKGSAQYYTDMPINDFYKFDTVEEVSAKVAEILQDTEKHRQIQKEYVDIIRHQHYAFKTEVHSLIGTYKELL